MNELIDAIRAAVAEGATPEQKAVGAQACRTILAALDAVPGKPILLPGAAPTRPLSGLSVDQVLDLAIARLTPIAAARETEPAHPQLAPARGLRIPKAAHTPPGAVRRK